MPDLNRHHCHAVGCPIPCRPEMLMCSKHWRLVPKAVQARVWMHYRDGQCTDMKFSGAWYIAAEEAIVAVALHEGKIDEAWAQRRIAKAKKDAAAFDRRLVGA